MSTRKTDFARLLRLQRAIKAMRERELAEARNREAAADRTLEDLSRMIDDGGPIAGLFPDLLARRFHSTLVEKVEAGREARESGDRLIRENRKLETIEDRLGEQRAAEVREGEEKAQAESLDQRFAGRMSGSSKLGRLR